MTYAAPSNDCFDDGLVHSHDWSRSTPPGGRHDERAAHARHKSHDHDDGLVHEHHWARA